VCAVCVCMCVCVCVWVKVLRLCLCRLASYHRFLQLTVPFIGLYLQSSCCLNIMLVIKSTLLFDSLPLCEADKILHLLIFRGSMFPINLSSHLRSRFISRQCRVSILNYDYTLPSLVLIRMLSLLLSLSVSFQNQLVLIFGMFILLDVRIIRSGCYIRKQLLSK